MIIDESMVRSFIKSEKERKVAEYQDEVMVLAVMAQTSIQLQKCVATGHISEFIRDRVMDTVMLINKFVICGRYYPLGEEMLLLFKKIMHILSPDGWIEEELITSRNGWSHLLIDSAEIKRVFRDVDLQYLRISLLLLSAIIRNQDYFFDEYDKVHINVINEWSEK